MIAYLKGKLLKKTFTHLLLEVSGVGYLVSVSEPLIADFNVGDEIELYTHQHVREDALELYGFKDYAALELFKLLISVSGVGPKTALAVFSVAAIDDIKEAIIRGDVGLLTKVSGIGKRSAERIVLDLKEKLGGIYGTAFSSDISSADELDALMALGYSLPVARQALQTVDKNIIDSAGKIREALRYLAKSL